MTYRFKKSRDVRSMEDVLLHDLTANAGLTPLFGIDARDGVIQERLLHERRMAGEKLQNISALLCCVEAYYQEFHRGETSRDTLIAKVWETLEVLHSQTECKDVELLVGP